MEAHVVSSMTQTCIIRVAVGSTNPCKINAVQLAFESIFPDCNILILSANVSSNVSDQPMGDSETRLGAKNRAVGIMNYFNNNCDSNCQCDFAVGLEGGCDDIVIVANDSNSNSNSDDKNKYDLWVMAWMAVMGRKDRMFHATADGITTMTTTTTTTTNNNDDENNNSNYYFGYGKTATFRLPSDVARLVKEEGMELGHADDMVFKRINSKHGGGTVGILTHGRIDRSYYYQHALRLALIPWMHPTLYFG